MNNPPPRLNQLTRKLGIACPSPETRLSHNWRNQQEVDIWVKRDDLLHPVISGNKWRKLSHALVNLTPGTTVISYGGGYSNHLHALAYCCQQLNLPFIAVVRGDYRLQPTPTLQDIENWQGEIQYVSKQTYQAKDSNAFRQSLQQRYPGAVIIPEGGSQQDALAGIQDMLSELTNQYDQLMAPVASGATLAGLICSQPEPVYRVKGVAVLKGENYLEQLVTGLLPAPSQCQHRWHIEHRYHHGGYAKSSPELLQFCDDFQAMSGIPVEPVYSGKLFYALKHLTETNQFPPQQKILAIHTGGLQGAR